MSKDAELLVLRHQNAVLRRQITRVRYTAADRIWLATVARMIPQRRWVESFAATPATVLAWHRRLVARRWDYRDRCWPGRRPTPAPTKTLIVRTPRGGSSYVPRHRRCWPWTSSTWTPAVTLQRLYCFFVMEVSSRYAHIVGVSSHPDEHWTGQQIRNL